ncbi:serine/threonine-protein phosphatase PGAM5, mitochondrial isoform X1 [Chelonia mydas]|uniref:serine/threonine-protein phosphatase PGAM5, mitochondrial isoform X1 n=1 Tax=Chelonia mydas TaxID=8469 RepID=UPI001CA8A6E2|nr:serine/threonine-protein phosphatase PGAM5, mitochondrial isoform X1 [Chelonia mydas]
MSFRRALALAACGLAGGSVLFSAVGVGKQPARGAGGDAETRSAGAAAAAPAPGLLLLPPAAASCPAAPGWAERAAGAGGYWDSNWDRWFPGSRLKHFGKVLREAGCLHLRTSFCHLQREPLALINRKKKNEETGEEELASRLDHCKTKATRHIFLIRHSQYNLDGRIDKDRTLTQLGREQAELTGRRLASLGLKFDTIIHSSMTRAMETTDIISKHLPGVKKISTDLLREGAPIEPVPPVSHWKPEAVQYYEDGARIEAAFRNYIHRADAKQEEDSYEIFVCHANVIRYIVCRALQFPPEGWLRMSLNNGSITHLVIRPSGRVALRTLGDTGFMPPDKITRT